jgi:hypothetical protein
MGPADWRARGEAYNEAAEHLKLSWTDDPQERAQGDIVTKLLLRESEKCHRIASDADKLGTMHGRSFPARERSTS